MSKEESKNRLEKALYIKSSMGKTQIFKPNHDCSARFLNFCSSEAEILKHEFYGTMCRPCMTEAKRIHEKALAEPVKPIKNWGEIKTGSDFLERKKYGSNGATKTLTRKERSDKKCRD